jgi:hypothetical protein
MAAPTKFDVIKQLAELAIKLLSGTGLADKLVIKLGLKDQEVGTWDFNIPSTQIKKAQTKESRLWEDPRQED